MLPYSSSTLLVRTDFNDGKAWEALKEAIATPSEDGFLADATIIDDRAYQDLEPQQLQALLPEDRGHRLLVLADRLTLSSDEMPLLVLDLRERPAGEIRVVPAEFWSIENNLSLYNMDFPEFVQAAGDDGVFRGF